MKPTVSLRSQIKTTLSQMIPWSGVFGPLIISLGILIAGFAYVGIEGQQYNLLNHFVSELGELGVSDLAWVFNGSLIIGGFVNTIFVVYLAIQFKGWIRFPLAILGLIATISSSLVGVFPMNYLDQHIFVALGFFNLGLLVALLYSIVLLFGKNHSFPRWLAIPGFLNTAAFFIFNNFPSSFEEGVDFQEGMGGLLSNRPDFIALALMEWVVILGIIIWFLVLGIYLVYKKKAY